MDNVSTLLLRASTTACSGLFTSTTGVIYVLYLCLNQLDLESVEVDMAELIDRKKWRRNVMNRKSNPIGKWGSINR